MSVICPRDGKYCPDDLCNGSNQCMGMPGYVQTMGQCRECGALVDDDEMQVGDDICIECSEQYDEIDVADYLDE